MLSVFAPLDGGELLAGLLLGNIAPFELTVGISIHFPAYLSLILRIKFVPEPSEWVMLVAGFGSLIVLYRGRVGDRVYYRDGQNPNISTRPV